MTPVESRVFLRELFRSHAPWDQWVVARLLCERFRFDFTRNCSRSRSCSLIAIHLMHSIRRNLRTENILANNRRYSEFLPLVELVSVIELLTPLRYIIFSMSISYLSQNIHIFFVQNIACNLYSGILSLKLNAELKVDFRTSIVCIFDPTSDTILRREKFD